MKRLIKLTARIYWVLAAFLWLAGVSMAQDTLTGQVPQPSYENPPAPQQPLPPGFVPAQQMPPQQPGAHPQGQAPYNDNSYFVPVQPTPSFDYFGDEDEYGTDDNGAGSNSNGNSKSGGEGKENFRFAEPSRTICHDWGNSLMGPTTFPDRGRCEMELGRKVDQGIAAIEDINDRFELDKLKKVIKGEIKDREDTKRYTLNFDSLRKSLSTANKEGCSCQD